MEQNSLQQKDLAAELGSQSVVSEILGGKRLSNARQAKALAARFAISPGGFAQFSYMGSDIRRGNYSLARRLIILWKIARYPDAGQAPAYA